MFLVCASYAQQEVVFNINHKLGTEDFALNMQSENQGEKYIIERLEYYISEISINHDGVSTNIEDLYLLVNGSEPVSVSLGMIEFQEIESVTFHIGVNEEVNHADPSLWPSDHPLFPKLPSMHWGWTGGYRFVAMEGNNNGVVWQLHGLGDSNYFTTTIMVEQRESDGKVHIDLDADYTAALEGIDVASGPISHGETGEARACLINFNERVFTQAGTLSNIVVENDLAFNIYPNPVLNGRVQLDLPSNVTSGQLNIIASDGRVVESHTLSGETTELQLVNRGVFIAQVIAADATFITQYIVVQ